MTERNVGRLARLKAKFGFIPCPAPSPNTPPVRVPYRGLEGPGPNIRPSGPPLLRNQFFKVMDATGTGIPNSGRHEELSVGTEGLVQP